MDDPVVSLSWWWSEYDPETRGSRLDDDNDDDGRRRDSIFFRALRSSSSNDDDDDANDGTPPPQHQHRIVVVVLLFCLLLLLLLQRDAPPRKTPGKQHRARICVELDIYPRRRREGVCHSFFCAEKIPFIKKRRSKKSFPFR